MTDKSSEQELKQAIERLKELVEGHTSTKEESLNLDKDSITSIISSKNLNLKEKDRKVSTIVTLGMKRKREEDYHPNEAQLEKINQFSKKTLKREDVYVFELQSADTNIDRAYEQFSSKAITRMAELSINKPVLMDHDWSVGATAGKIFDAKNQNGKLVQTAYFPSNSPVVENIMNGLIDKLSVGFALEPEQFVCSACSKSMFSMECPHSPGEKNKAGEVITATIKDVSDYFEVSLVAVPCQPDAHIRQGKGASGGGGTITLNYDGNLTINKEANISTNKEDAEEKSFATVQEPDELEKDSPTVDTIENGNNLEKELLMSENTNVEAVVEEKEVEMEAPAEVEQPSEAVVEAEDKEVVEEKSVEEAIAEPTAPVIKEVDLSPITEKVASLEAKLEEVIGALKTANEKLETLVSQPTTALSKKLAAEADAEADDYKKKYWVLNKFDLVGGQE